MARLSRILTIGRFRSLHSLRTQLTTAMLTVLAMGLGLSLFIAGNQIARTTMEAFVHEQQVLTLVLATDFSQSPDNSYAQQIISAWATHTGQAENDFPADANVTVFNPQGQFVISSAATSSDMPLSPDLDGALSGTVVSENVDNYLYIAAPMIHDGHILVGVVQLDSSLDSVNGQIRNSWLILIGASGAALFLALLAALWLSAKLTYPLSELREVAQEMAEGRLDTRIALGNTVSEVEALGTAFNHMAEQIEGMMQEQRDFVANASHELRSPLAAIKLRAEALAYRMVNGERAEQYAADINDEVSRLAQLVNDLLQLSRAESGTFAPPEQPITLADELAASVRAVQPRLTLKHQQFTAAFADDLPDVYIHANDLRIMVGNLLDNAIKYTPDGGAIGLSAVQKAGNLEMTVQDNGEGIPPQDLNRISERFFRVDRAHTRNTPGFGLGLALVLAVVRQYSGQLSIESSGLAGQGTCAKLQIPMTNITKANSKPLPEVSSLRPPTPPSARTVLPTPHI